MQPIPLVRKVALAPAISYLTTQGVPVDRYLRVAKLSAPTPDTYESLIPLRQLCVFLNSVADGEGIHDLGFHIAGPLGMEFLGAYGRIVAEALTFHETIQISSEMCWTYNSGLRIWLERHGDQVKYCLKHTETLPPGGNTVIDHMGLANALAAGGIDLGSSWRPSRIELPTDPIDLGIHFPELHDIPVRFNQPYTAIWFDSKWLSRPLPLYELSVISRPDDNERAFFLTASPSRIPVGQLGQAIESALGHPEIGLQMTAAIVGMSSRTIQRHLAEEGQSFSRVLQSVRFRMAQQFLCETSMRLTEIASRLSYADLSNFIRAFKRWTGVGPNEFRKLHKEDRHE